MINQAVDELWKQLSNYHDTADMGYRECPNINENGHDHAEAAIYARTAAEFGVSVQELCEWEHERQCRAWEQEQAMWDAWQAGTGPHPYADVE